MTLQNSAHGMKFSRGNSIVASFAILHVSFRQRILHLVEGSDTSIFWYGWLGVSVAESLPSAVAYIEHAWQRIPDCNARRREAIAAAARMSRKAAEFKFP